LQDILDNPAVQGGVAPLFAGLLVAVALSPWRLGGLAIITGFALSTYLVSGIQFSPLTATRKLFVVALGAAVLGPVVDFAFKPTRLGAAILALASGAAALWVFWPILAQKQPSGAWLLGSAAAAGAALAVAIAQLRLASDGLRAGACGLALGLGAGIGAFIAASLSYALYGVALAAASGAFLLPQMIRGKPSFAGATFLLPAMVIGMLVACGAMLLAQMPWYAVLTLALVPAAVSLPGPKGPAWLQAVVHALYGFVVAGAACALAWPASSTN
jgi:hypothetical protein